MSNETLKIFGIWERSKSRFRSGGTKVWKAEEVGKYFVNPKIGNFQLVCKLQYLQFGFQKYLMSSLFIGCENDEWYHFVVDTSSPAINSFYYMCFVSFYFFLFFSFFMSSVTCGGIEIS